ncbi:MAG: response regulator [Burkholderiaceae bacterium]
MNVPPDTLVLERTSLRMRRGLAAVVIAGLVGMWWGAWFEVERSRENALQQAGLRMEAKADVFAEFARTVLRTLDAALVDIRPHVAIDLQVPEALVEQHKKTLEGAVLHMSTLDRNGRVRFSTDSLTGADFSERPMFVVHRDNKGDRLFISLPQGDFTAEGRRQIHFSRPILIDGVFEGVLQLSVDPVIFANFARSLATRDGDVLTMFQSESGTVMARHPDPARAGANQVIQGGAFMEPDAPMSGSFRRVSQIDGKPRVYAYRTLEDFPVTLVAGRDESRVLGQLASYRLWVFGTSAVMTFGFAGLLWVLMRALRRIDRDKADLADARVRAEAANREKSRFLATMSHEIRTPLNGVVGMSQLMLGTALTAEQRDYASNIAQSGQAVVAIVNDILDFSRIEAGRLELRPQPFSMQECIDVVMGMFRYEAGTKRIELRSEIDPQALGTYLGDSLRIRQVLINLLGNAIKFTEQGHVTLRIGLAAASQGALPASGSDAGSTDSGQGDPVLQFDVIDTGVGIPPSARNALFKVFSQVDSSSTRRHGGTGLGLVISKELVDAMGGEIGLMPESADGADRAPGATPIPGAGGSHFWFRLPLQRTQQLPVRLTVDTASTLMQPDDQAAEPAAADTAGKNSTRPRLLLAEDHIVNQKVVVIMLARLGYGVDLAENGEEAVQAASRKPYDLILMDVRMPVMDGLDATRAIRTSVAAQGKGLNADTPIVAVTANALAEDRELCLAAGMNDFLPKPILMDQLDRCLRQWLPKNNPTPGD